MSNNGNILGRISAFVTEKHRHLTWSFSLFFLLVFILLSIFVAQSAPMSFDLLVSSELQENQNRILDLAMRAISWLGTLWVAGTMVAAISILFLISGYRREAVFMFSTLLSGGLTYVLKIMVNRPRPTQDLINVLEQAHYQSFPSGHVLFYTAFFGSLMIIAVTSKILSVKTQVIITVSCLAMIVLCAVSRIYLGAHWFTDVIAGFCAGTLFLMITGTLYIRSKRKAEKAAEKKV
ncbi:hypothetical protein ASG01_12545 [Chryseobacterium sp. Leaf180]|uniref:phosphatase PAP2 family protein n=1 Tax=Chryseobacterium sp. Leaf180 TaxID=1736289 RepID=UPI0006FD4B72|nr:phosphatase PAP2 family protein [Chryseobacterium sp. Leaf180]KQR91830.1 hypothetical protein ASG01_12545 [Chryseobacterium sp. Leaf180]